MSRAPLHTAGPGAAVTVALLLAASTFFTTAAAAADEEREKKLQCVEAYSTSQELRREGRLLDARDRLLTCSQSHCPLVVQQDCGKWLREVELAQPTVVLVVQDPDGRDLTDVEVRANGRELTDALSGKAIPLDPGPVTLELRAPGHRPGKKELLVVEGQKLRQVQVVLTPVVTEPKAPEPGVPGPGPGLNLGWPTWVLAGVGVVGFGAFAGFGISARSSDRALDSCTPNCERSDVDSIKTRYLLANVSVGVGAAGLLGALAWALFVPAPSATPEDSARGDEPVSAPRWSLGFSPGPGYVEATFGGRF